MTARRHQLQQDETELDMTPMLDIVFIMLIFFIVTTSFVKESGIDVNPPSAATAAAKENANIFIAINAQGQVWLDKREVDIRTVKAIVARLHASTPDAAVVIQADSESSTKHLIAVMDQLRLAGIDDIAIAATPES